MKIVKRAKGEASRFVVERTFYWGGRKVGIGEEIRVENPGEGEILVAAKKVRPILPLLAVYIALVDFQLPGSEKKHEARKGERVELRDSDALPLLLLTVIVPESSSVWRPYNRGTGLTR